MALSFLVSMALALTHSAQVRDLTEIVDEIHGPAADAKALVDMVIRANGLEPGRFSELGKRAGNAAWLPVLEIRVDRNIEDDKTGTRSRSVSVSSSGVFLGPDDETYVLSTDDDWRIRVRAVWELDRLVYDRDELKAMEREMKAAEVRSRILGRALKAFLDIEAARLELARENDPAKRQKLRAKMASKTLFLDSLTAGRFSTWYASRRRDREKQGCRPPMKSKMKVEGNTHDEGGKR